MKKTDWFGFSFINIKLKKPNPTQTGKKPKKPSRTEKTELKPEKIEPKPEKNRAKPAKIVPN
jgi:hypothetical protein